MNALRLPAHHKVHASIAEARAFAPSFARYPHLCTLPCLPNVASLLRLTPIMLDPPLRKECQQTGLTHKQQQLLLHSAAGALLRPWQSW